MTDPTTPIPMYADNGFLKFEVSIPLSHREDLERLGGPEAVHALVIRALIDSRIQASSKLSHFSRLPPSARKIFLTLVEAIASHPTTVSVPPDLRDVTQSVPRFSGRVLVRIVGVSEMAVTRGLKGLVTLGLVSKTRSASRHAATGPTPFVFAPTAYGLADHVKFCEVWHPDKVQAAKARAEAWYERVGWPKGHECDIPLYDARFVDTLE